MKACELGSTALILAGGVGLGAYHGGVFARLQDLDVRLKWIAASSVGAVNAALIAGNPPNKRIAALREFWTSGDQTFNFFFRPFGTPSWRHVQNWMKAIETRLFGAAGHFRPRMLTQALEPFSSVYDLGPMRQRIEQLVDFDRLNAGDIRCSMACTDIETGEMVLFDTARGTNITIEHVLASCGFLPEFPPVEIGGRLLGDGGLSGNAPIEAMLEGDGEVRTILVVDLYPRDGARPRDYETALARKTDLVFGNQTYLRLEAYRRELLLREEIRRLRNQPPQIKPRLVLLSYQATPEEAGSERAFDLSSDSAERRWSAGVADVDCAFDTISSAVDNDAVLTVRRVSTGAVRGALDEA
jgi:NTE family protein